MAEMNIVCFYPPGGPEQLKYEKSPIPQDLKDGQMLVKVHACSVIWPELYWPVYQAKDGAYVPHIPCHDFSGTVTKIGTGFDDSEMQVGSEVCCFTPDMTDQWLRQYEGGLAEYAIADLKTAVLKPRNMTLLEAASVPLSALTAWQALYDHIHLQKGQRLLITGAAGATGFWAVQIAKIIGVYVIGTASDPRSFEILEGLGIDEIVNYKTQNLEDAVKDIDVVLDTVGGKVMEQCRKVLKKDGKLLSIVDYDITEKLKEVDAKFFIVSMNKDQLKEIVRLIEEGKLRTFIDSTFPLEKAVEAFKKGHDGHAHGKIMVEIGG